MIVTCLIGWQVYLDHHAPIYEDHDLLVTQIVGPYSWMTRKPNGREVRLDFCKNFEVADLEPAPGYTIETIVAQDRGSCLNLLPANKYLISWKKGPSGWAVKDN